MSIATILARFQAGTISQAEAIAAIEALSDAMTGAYALLYYRERDERLRLETGIDNVRRELEKALAAHDQLIATLRGVMR